MKVFLCSLCSVLAIACGLPLTANAQSNGIPIQEFISRDDKAALDVQADELFQKFDKITGPFSDSVIYICRSYRNVNWVVALGTVIAPGKVLTKWSDIAVTRGALIAIYKDEIYDVRPVGENQEHDLLLLDVPSLKAPAFDFNKTASIEEGDFVLTVMPSGHTGDFGVVSVGARSLRTKDIPYIGVITDMTYSGKGIMVRAVENQTGARAAGIQPNDIVLKVNGLETNSLLDIRKALENKKPGDKVEVLAQRDKKELNFDITLIARAPGMQFPEKRLEAMNAAGNPMSPRRGDFPQVIQTDMTLKPSHAGAPVVDIEGRAVGLALSRAGRTETYILPASLIADSLKQGISGSTDVASNGKIEEIKTPEQREQEKRTSEYLDDLRNMQHGIQKAEIVEE